MYVEVELLGSLEIDHQFEFGRTVDGQVARLIALEVQPAVLDDAVVGIIRPRRRWTTPFP